LCQLKSETVNGVKTKVEYDNYGNITAKGVVDETGAIAEATKDTYVYGNGVWKDLLTSYNGQAIEYDAQGNPISYLGHTLTWEKGRQLKQFVKTDGTSISYTYNANGIRTSKTVNGALHTYTLDGTKILREEWAGNTIVPLYDNEESVCGILYNDEPYYFTKNLQGDIISIVNKSGGTVARYSYDAWGVLTIKEDISSCHISEVNPYRYRGYYYDSEIGLYYVSSRYYNPEIGRWINEDNPTMIFETEINFYTFCCNIPITHIDLTGMKSKDKNMGIVNSSKLPLSSYTSKTIDNATSVNWQVTSNFKNIAKNHCAAVAVTNLAMYFYKCGYYNLMVDTRRKGRSAYETFVEVHKIVGNGPVVTVAEKAKKYFKSRGYSLKSSSVFSIGAVKKAIDKNRPVVTLIANGLFSWHQIICIGYRMYTGGAFYMRVIDGWNNSTNKYYRVYQGSLWMSSTQYWM